MERAKLIILSFIAVLVTPLAAITSATAAVIDCEYQWSSDYSLGHTWGPLGVNVVDVGFEVYYRNCAAENSNVRHATPLKFVINCRSRGPGDPQSVVHNAYFSDFDGRSYNPQPKSMNCDSRDWVERTYGVPDPKPRFHRCAAGPPRWVDDVKINVPTEGDKYAKVASNFWGFSGPTPVNC